MLRFGLSLGVCLVALASTWPLPVAGQTKWRDGVVIRKDLKGFSGGNTVLSSGVTATKQPSRLECSTNHVCESSLFVFPGGYDGDEKTWLPSLCSVYWPYSEIVVKQGSQPILRWVIAKASYDRATYAFHPAHARGIRLEPPKDPANANDSRYDLFKPSRDPSGTAFEWHSLNMNPTGKTKRIQYVPVIQRLNKDGTTTTCNAADPEVVNEN